MENLPKNRMKATEELVRGREFANQLRKLIHKSTGNYHKEEDDDASTAPYAQHLLDKVLDSFSNTLLLLNNRPREHRMSHDVVVSQLHVPSKSQDSQESCRSSTIKDRRGCYKRRRTSASWEQESEGPIDDGHAWRKYGQKIILNTKYPRNYFRCTHKFDQGCLATKQVQRIEEKPSLYRTTYYGHHTCRNLLNPEIILDSDSLSQSSILLSFDNTFPITQQENPFSSSPSFPSIEKECKQEIINPSSSSKEYLLSPELTFDDFSKHLTLFSTLECDHGGVFSDPDPELDGFFENFEL